MQHQVLWYSHGDKIKYLENWGAFSWSILYPSPSSVQTGPLGNKEEPAVLGWSSWSPHSGNSFKISMVLDTEKPKESFKLSISLLFVLWSLINFYHRRWTLPWCRLQISRTLCFWLENGHQEDFNMFHYKLDPHGHSNKYPQMRVIQKSVEFAQIFQTGVDTATFPTMWS